MRNLMKRAAAVMAAATLVCVSASAEVFDAVTAAQHTAIVQTKSGGLLTELSAHVGDTVTAGQQLGVIEPDRVYATQDGTVADILYKEGDHASGTVLKLSPVSHYLIYCTTDGGYDAPDNMLVHMGETLYVACTNNGTHMGVGRVVSIDGKEYHLEMQGGELYIGETVYLYRDKVNNSKCCVGKGTVLSSDDENYSVTGTILQMAVNEGDRVSRGQLLLTWANDEDITVTAGNDGVVTAVSASAGETLRQDQTVLEITPYENIMIKLTLTEEQAQQVKVGQKAEFFLMTDAVETTYSAEITEISALGSSDQREVWLKPDTLLTTVGTTVSVTISLY